jgi:hypothetical protein
MDIIDWLVFNANLRIISAEMFTLGSLTRSFTSHPKSEFTGPDFTRIYPT